MLGKLELLGLDDLQDSGSYGLTLLALQPSPFQIPRFPIALSQ